jgi:hypothetical protein
MADLPGGVHNTLAPDPEGAYLVYQKVGSPAPGYTYRRQVDETYLYQVTKAYEPFADDSKVVPPLKFTDEENSAMSVIKANLSNSIKQGMFAFFNGTKPIENDYDAWIAELESNGLKDLIAYYQNAYDAQYK